MPLGSLNVERMGNPSFHDPRLTEQRNPASEAIDVASALEIVDLINAQDATVPAAVHAERETIAAMADAAVAAFRAGGRLIYVGAGTSGRLGVLDAAECPPTFGSPPGMVMGIVAGGHPALVGAQEGAEDDTGAARRAVDDVEASGTDLVIGIAASGTTPFVQAALARAVERGATVGLVACSTPPSDVRALCRLVVVLQLGPELLTGSTRMKAGTATKLVLNSITTAAMLRLGKAYGNLMVDLMATSAKLVDRGERIVMEITGVARDAARVAIDRAEGSVKFAIVMLERGVDLPEARRLVDAANGFLRPILGDPPPILGA